MEHFLVKFGDPSCIGFCDIVRKNRHTDNGGENLTPAAAGLAKSKKCILGFLWKVVRECSNQHSILIIHSFPSHRVILIPSPTNF